MRNIIITGANDGIGYHMALQLLQNGDRVAVLDIATERIEALLPQYPDNLLICQCDAAEADAVTNAVRRIEEAWGAADIAVHNACLCAFTSLEDTTESSYRRVWQVNFMGAVNLSKAVLPSMKAHQKGKVCFVSSGVGVMGFADLSAYAASKGAVEALAKCLDIEYRAMGVTFHIVHPPLTRTASSAPLPIPKEMMADAQKVGRGLARRLRKKSFIITHSFGQRLQVRMAYLLGIRLGRLMSKLTQQTGQIESTASKKHKGGDK